MTGCLAVEIVIVIISKVSLAPGGGGAATRGPVREPEMHRENCPVFILCSALPEVVSEASGLLQSLAEHLVLLDIIIGNRPEI